MTFKLTRHKNTNQNTQHNFSKSVNYITVGFALRSQGFEIKRTVGSASFYTRAGLRQQTLRVFWTWANGREELALCNKPTPKTLMTNYRHTFTTLQPRTGSQPCEDESAGSVVFLQASRRCATETQLGFNRSPVLPQKVLWKS